MKRNEFVKETKQRLINRRDALRQALAGDMSMLRAQQESAGDEVDLAIAAEHAEMQSQMASFESRELAQIENALARIKEGRYGRCETCDEPIAPMRLKALPYAVECISCARREERRGASANRYSPVNRIAGLRGADENEPASDEAFEVR